MLPAPSDLEDSSDPQTEAAACFLSWSSGVAAFPWGSPAVLEGLAGTRGLKPVCMCEVSIRWLALGANSSLEQVQ